MPFKSGGMIGHAGIHVNAQEPFYGDFTQAPISEKPGEVGEWWDEARKGNSRQVVKEYRLHETS